MKPNWGILKNLKGRRFNMLKVESINETVSKRKGRPYWNCKCDCGKTIAITHGRLIYDAVYSCGCTRRTRGKKRFYVVKHSQLSA
jgi:hypothetical protein